MGGDGSGRWLGSMKKTLVERCLPLDVNKLKHALYEGPGCSGTVHWSTGARVEYKVVNSTDGPALQLNYSVDGTDYSYLVRTATTRCHFGGRRFWLRCPARSCGRRVGKLYLPPHGRYYLCRHCHQLSYRSRQEHRKYDPLWRLLGAESNLTKKQMDMLFRGR